MSENQLEYQCAKIVAFRCYPRIRKKKRKLAARKSYAQGSSGSSDLCKCLAFWGRARVREREAREVWWGRSGGRRGSKPIEMFTIVYFAPYAYTTTRLLYVMPIRLG